MEKKFEKKIWVCINRDCASDKNRHDGETEATCFYCNSKMEATTKMVTKKIDGAEYVK